MPYKAKQTQMNRIDSCIQSFLNGTLHAEEHAYLRKWVKQNRRQRNYFYHAIALWKATAIHTNEANYDVNKAIALFKKQNQRATKPNTIRQVLNFSSAAMLLIGISSLAYFYLLMQKSGHEGAEKEVNKEYVVEVPAGAKSKVVFPDGSVVWLNAGSKISYAANFATTSREVKLTGEGYFEISKNSKMPFVVHTPKLAVQVLGTKFNLRSYDEDAEAKVILKEGSVVVEPFLGETSPITLHPNQRLTYLKANKMMLVDSVNADLGDHWRKGLLVFDCVSLEEITKELRRLYDIPIQIENEKLKNIIYYSDFQENMTLEKVLEILSSGNKFRYELRPELVRIYC